MSSFTESQIRSAEREIADLGRRCSDYLRQEQDLNKKISDLRKELSRVKPDDSFRNMKESNIRSYESRLADITRWHIYYEQQRESKLKDLNRLRQQLDYERREEVRKQEYNEKREEKRRRQAEDLRAKAEREYQRQNIEQETRTTVNTYQSKPAGPGFLKTFCYIFLGLIALGLVSRLLHTPTSDNTAGQTANISLSELSTASMGMIDYMGLTVADIEGIYGKDYTVDWGTSGGYWIIYPADSDCPYAFLYRGKEQSDNDEIPKSDDLICGVISGTVGTTVMGTAKIGMDHKDFEAGIGQIYITQSEPESDYTLPTAWIDFEAKGANETEKGNYSLMVLEDSEQVVYALLYKQAG